MTLRIGSTKVNAGGYWRGGKWIAMTWGDKIRKSLDAKPLIKKICHKCGKEFEVKESAKTTAKWCSWECMYANNYTDSSDPVLKKAKVLGANLLMGKGKLQTLLALVKAAVHSKCPYCDTILNIHNMSIDHMEPYRSAEARRNKKVNEVIRRKLDVIENLHMVCRRCNILKYDLNHQQFLSFLDFMNKDPQMKESIIKRLNRSHAPFRRG